ncbi:MAG: hypothetical protein HUJ80_08215 [Firmicutes bacterium]|nr:hypothetical protein [Bacillota bacterium]
MKKIKLNKKIIIILAAVLVAAAVGAFFLLKSKKPAEEELSEEPVDNTIEAPLQYAVGEKLFTALPVSGETVTVTAGEVDEEGTILSYCYSGYKDMPGLLSGYSTLMCTSDLGFSRVDEEMEQLDETTLAAPLPAEGTLRLLHKEEISPTAQLITVTWKGQDCTVAAKSTVIRPKKVAKATSSAAAMTITDVQDYVQNLKPSYLGLDGESMAEYNVYLMDGYARMGDTYCMRFNVYRTDGVAGTNEIAGMYTISCDSQKVYRYDADARTVTELSE